MTTFAQYLLAEEETKVKKLDDYDTIMAILDGKLKSTKAPTFTKGEQHVQQTLLADEGDYRLFYITIYDPDPEYSDVEAYVLFDKKSKEVSFYDFMDHNIYVDGKHIGKTSNTDSIDEFVKEFNLEAVSAPHKGAPKAYYNVLKEL